MSSFDERLSELRTEKKKTHQDMADILGITRQAYGHYESGKRQPDYNTLTKLSDYFGVIVDYLIGKSDSRTAEELAAKWNTDSNRSGSTIGEGRAYYGGGSDWSEEEKAAADAYIEVLRKQKANREKKW